MARPDLSFKAPCEEPIRMDTFSYSQRKPILSGRGPNGSIARARMTLWGKLSPQELLVYRRANREWNVDINNILATRVSTLLLFSDRESASQYNYMLTSTKLIDDAAYSVVNTAVPFGSMAIFVNDVIDAINDGKFFHRFAAVTRLVYFGAPSLNAEGQFGQSWHEQMFKLVEKYFPMLKALMVNHLGHYPVYMPLTSHENVYTRLQAIHLVDPAESILENLKGHNAFKINAGYVVDSRSEPKTDTHSVNVYIINTPRRYYGTKKPKIDTSEYSKRIH